MSKLCGTVELVILMSPVWDRPKQGEPASAFVRLVLRLKQTVLPEQ